MRKFVVFCFGLCLLFSFSIAGTRSSLVGNHVITTKYLKKAFARRGYDYAPTTIKDDDGIYKMWWCGNPEEGVYDYIYYSSSINNGTVWNMPQVVMPPTPLALVSDPSVVKVGSTYYMYFTGTRNAAGTENDIYLATSTDGLTWTKYPNNESPVPVLPRAAPVTDNYGCGQPSVLFLNNEFVVYFLDQEGNPGGMYRATSSDGINFGPRTYIMLANDVDIKYSTTQNCFVMVRGGQFDSNLRVYLHVSYDGLVFTPVDNSKYVAGPPSGETRTISCGLAGDKYGQITDSTLVYYSIGNPNNVNGWEIHISQMNVFYNVQNTMYRFLSMSTRAKDHYYTFNPNNPPYYDYEQKAWIAPADGYPGATPFYRLYNPITQDHFYTADYNERSYAISQCGYYGEGNEGYVYTSPSSSTVPIYRLVQPDTTDHFYTINYDEVNYAISVYGYRYEQIAGYVFQY